ncbi:hypothetical protein [Sorangium sp. So ce131]|uniref:hypothetical protein n=1 Tax=Sorangium sp. So ce131 TaxID=3133282 RepID=UPI003F631AD3
MLQRDCEAQLIEVAVVVERFHREWMCVWTAALFAATRRPRLGNPSTWQQIVGDDTRRIGREREYPVNNFCDALTRRSLKMCWQHRDCAIRVIDRDARERDGAAHSQNVIQLMSVLFRMSKWFHMQRVLLGKLAR